MNSPRYVVRTNHNPLTLFPYYQIYDSVKKKRLLQLYRRKRSADKRADRLNAAYNKQTDAYRKAKDNG